MFNTILKYTTQFIISLTIVFLLPGQIINVIGSIVSSILGLIQPGTIIEINKRKNDYENEV